MRCPGCGAVVHYRTASDAMANFAGAVTAAAVAIIVTLLAIAAIATLVAYIGRTIS